MNTHHPLQSFSGLPANFLPLARFRWAAVLAALTVALSASAGSFFSDFNSGLPAGAAIYGNSAILPNQGYTNSGCLMLVSNVASQNGGFVITNDLDAGAAVVGFTARFKVYIGPLGGTGADGFSFNFAPDLPAGTISEEGAGTGLTVEFDTFTNDANSDQAGIDVKVGGNEIATFPWAGLRTGAYVDAVIQLHPDGTLDVIYDGFHAYTNLNVRAYGLPAAMTGYRFGLGARTGGSWDNHFIDNLGINTFTNGTAFVDYYFPIGRSVRADAPIRIDLSDFSDPITGDSVVNTNKIILQLDGTNVVPVVVNNPPLTTIQYLPPALLASGSSHAVSLTYADSATPTPHTNTWQWAFTVATFANLPAPVSPSLVSATHGFAVRVSQIDVNRGATIQRAENQLANLLIDPDTGRPYTNRATIQATNEPVVINYSTYGYQGDFATELPNSIPGLPGMFPDTTSSGDTNAALDAVTYLYLTPGLYTLGVNSSDGFRLTAASTPDIFATEEAVYDGVRASADSTATFGVTTTGYYPFRICYFIGGPELVSPTADNPSLEFFSADSVGNKILINDTSTTGFIPAYLPAKTLPYVRSVSPAPGTTGVSKNAPVTVTLVDGSITVQTNTIALWVNGTNVVPAISTTAGITTVQYVRSGTWPLNSTNTVQIAFTDSASTPRTNSWQFVTENVLVNLFVIPPASSTNATWAKWVTSAGTERGIAYNPKTGHVLIVSRSGAGGSDGPAGGGIGIFDGNDGHYLSKLNVLLPDSTYITNGVGTYKINMVDVAEDGVIYVCNLATSTAQNFMVYRWQDEGSAPTVACNATLPNSSGGRIGDDFTVRGSGAGTEILACGNSQNAPGPTNTVCMCNTVDGTNFSLNVVGPITGLPNNVVRLGIAWGCGNTFYGETTGTGNPLRYASFTGLPATTGILITNYPILDGAGNPYIGPIGVDIPNQRVIAASTAGTGGAAHSMNLFDLDTLLPGVTNRPVDSKPFAVNVGTFGTGAVDFTPDGTRVYTLDSGSGVIAFTLVPKLAAPTICAQPKNYLVTAGVAFLDVGAIGAPQSLQWRFRGVNPLGAAVPVANATNRTLDIYNPQPSQLGYYDVRITNSLGSVTSLVAYVDLPMAITNQPVSVQVNPAGGPANFSVGVTGGLLPYTYQWTLNGTNISGGSTLSIPSAQVSNAGGYTVTITDAVGQALTSDLAVLTVGAYDNGTGLTGDYYSNIYNTNGANFVGPPTLTRVDPTVDFEWGTGSPDGSITTDYFMTRWHGQVKPLYTDPWTFTTRTDDGVRLWVNGQLVVNQWIPQAPTDVSGTLTLVAHQPYDLVMEYFEQTGGAVAHLSWSSPHRPKEIVPMTQLYPSASGAVQPILSTGVSNGTNLVLNWTGTMTLLSAPKVTGPWTPVVTNASPFTVNMTLSPQSYYRIVNQD